MAYLIGQIFGILATLCCFIGPFWKKKWQMLVNSIMANLFVAINLLMIGEIGSAIIMNIVAIIQILFSLYHVFKQKPVTIIENIIFLIAYVGLGIMGAKKPLDALPVLGAILFMISVFQRDEQKTRMISLGNIVTYLVYYCIIGSTSLFAQIVSFITTVIALYKYRKKVQ